MLLSVLVSALQFREEHGLYGAKRIAAALNDPDSGAHCLGRASSSSVLTIR